MAGAAAAGVIAGVLFGAVMPAEEMMPMVAALYGFDGVIAGWVFHLLHSIVFAVVFAVAAPQIVRGLGDSPAWAAIAGLAYGAGIWLVFAAFVMPLWIGAVTDMSPPVPDWNWLSLVGHTVYGVSLGALLRPLTRPAR